MPKLTRARARAFGVAGLVGGLGLSAAVVWQASYSAFSATTDNPTNNWTAGSVVLVDDDGGAALFTVPAMKPGDSGTKCIVVTSNSNVTSNVRLYTTSSSISQTLNVADNLNMTITQGTSTSTGGDRAGWVADGGATNTTSRTLTSFGSAYNNFANGFGTWSAAAGAGVKKTYQISWVFNASAPNTTQGGTAQIGFTWEARSS